MYLIEVNILDAKSFYAWIGSHIFHFMRIDSRFPHRFRDHKLFNMVAHVS